MCGNYLAASLPDVISCIRYVSSGLFERMFTDEISDDRSYSTHGL